MSTAIKLRYGTTAEHASSIGLAREVAVDITKNTLVLHNGVTPGGFPMARESALSAYLPLSGGTMTGTVNEVPGAFVASSSTVDLTNTTGNFVHITGTTQINSITLQHGAERTVVFDGALTLVHGSTKLPSAAHISVAAGDVAIFRGEGGGNVQCVSYMRVDGTSVAASSAVGVPPSVRQTVLDGPVDVNGLSSFGGSTGSTTVTASGTLTATAANGTSNRTGSITNPSWTGLSTNGNMYLYLDIGSSGTCTTGSSTLRPNYRWGGNDVITNGQNTFNIQSMTMKVGDGTSASTVWRVFVGEVTVAGGIVTAITWYSLRGRYRSATTSTLPSNGVNVTFAHNIGVNQDAITGGMNFFAINTTSDSNWAVGSVVEPMATVTGTGLPSISHGLTSHTSASVTGGSNGTGWQHINRTTGSAIQLVRASWSYYATVSRGW